jgi:translation initiation factor 1
VVESKRMKKLKTTGLVYSTDTGQTCPGCGHPVQQCCCSKKSQPPGDGVVRVSRQTKGRKGSGVCLVTGVPLGESELKKLAKQLKKKCGTGGTLKNGVIEIQGDHRQTLVDALIKAGYQAKLAGG